MPVAMARRAAQRRLLCSRVGGDGRCEPMDCLRGRPQLLSGPKAETRQAAPF